MVSDGGGLACGWWQGLAAKSLSSAHINSDVSRRRVMIWLSVAAWLACFPVGLIRYQLSFTSAVVFTIVWGGAILAVWFFVLWLGDHSKPSVEDVLSQRYGRGEIDEDEYRRDWEAVQRMRGDDGAGQVEDALSQRYGRGEIDEDKYRRDWEDVQAMRRGDGPASR